MRWLVTVDASAQVEEVRVELGLLDAELDPAIEPIPLPPDELVVFVDGPADLAALIGPSTPHLRHAYPDSEPTAYR